MKERIQKILAHAGIASRRKAEDLIREGAVTVNGQIAKIGDSAEFGKDAIKVYGKLLLKQEAPVYLLFNKPKNVISSLNDPEGRPSVGDYLKRVKFRVYPVGRLDFSSEGALLLTNDGDLAEKLQKSNKLLRVYHIKVTGHPRDGDLERLRRGGRVEGRLIVPQSVRVVEHFSQKGLIEIVIEGSSGMELKRFIEHKQFLVSRMVRVGIGHLRLTGLHPGEYRHLEKSQVEALLNQPELGLRLLDLEAKKTRLKPESDEEGDEEGQEELKPKKPLPPAKRADSRPSRPASRDMKKPTGRRATFTVRRKKS